MPACFCRHGCCDISKFYDRNKTLGLYAFVYIVHIYFALYSGEALANALKDITTVRMFLVE